MKQTRKVVLVFFAVGVVLLLSSCSAMLDAIYPERQIINVTAKVALASHLDTATTGSYVNVQLTDTFGNTLSNLVVNTPTSSDATYAYYNFQFTKLKNATYGLYSYYHSASSSGDYPPLGTYGPFYGTIYFSDPSSSIVSLVNVPYYQSSDTTNLLVVIN
jgi:hypothetical protein